MAILLSSKVSSPDEFPPPRDDEVLALGMQDVADAAMMRAAVPEFDDPVLRRNGRQVQMAGRSRCSQPP